METLLVSAKDLGTALRDLRKQQGLTQKEAGRRVGLDQKKVSLLENGNANMRLDSLLRLLSSLGVGISLKAKVDFTGSEGDTW